MGDLDEVCPSLFDEMQLLKLLKPKGGTVLPYKWANVDILHPQIGVIGRQDF